MRENHWSCQNEFLRFRMEGGAKQHLRFLVMSYADFGCHLNEVCKDIGLNGRTDWLVPVHSSSESGWIWFRRVRLQTPSSVSFFQGGPGSVRLRFGGGTVPVVPVLRFWRFLRKSGFIVFQYSSTGRDGSGSGVGSWKTVLAVPVPLSVLGKNGSDGCGFQFQFGSWATLFFALSEFLSACNLFAELTEFGAELSEFSLPKLSAPRSLIRLRMRMLILMRRKQLLASFSDQISNRKLWIQRCESIRWRWQIVLQMKWQNISFSLRKFLANATAWCAHSFETVGTFETVVRPLDAQIASDFKSNPLAIRNRSDLKFAVILVAISKLLVNRCEAIRFQVAERSAIWKGAMLLRFEIAAVAILRFGHLTFTRFQVPFCDRERAVARLLWTLGGGGGYGFAL